MSLMDTFWSCAKHCMVLGLLVLVFDVLQDMNFVPSKADADDWMRPATDESCSEYIAVYVDDLAITATNPKEITDQLQHK